MLRLSLFLTSFCWAAVVQAAEPATRVFLNGVPSPVYFNDGDSFRVLGGKFVGSKARLAGFNTLESYGPAHRWGGWTAKELYVLAKMATHNAAKGTWTCTSDLETDTYGRTLWSCPDLSLDQVRKGYAHVLSVDARPGDPKLLEAQAEAIREKRGMWAHGVPAYVMTSLHSITEDGGKDGKTYNRIVSSIDGHSASWAHSDSYSECEWVCSKQRIVSDAIVSEAAKALRTDPEAGPALNAMVDAQLLQVVGDYARLGWFVGIKDDSLESLLKSKLEAMRAAGSLGAGEPEDGSCMLYVEFTRRYGNFRPECLR